MMTMCDQEKKGKERKKKDTMRLQRDCKEIEVLGEEEVDRENGLGEQEICRRWITL